MWKWKTKENCKGRSKLVSAILKLYQNNYRGCRHSSVDSSAPTILPPWVRVPSTPSFIVFVLYFLCEKNEKEQKEAGLGPFLKNKTSTSVSKSSCNFHSENWQKSFIALVPAPWSSSCKLSGILFSWCSRHRPCPWPWNNPN